MYEEFCNLYEKMVAGLYARGQDPGDTVVPASFKWKSPSEIPAANLFNMDEMGSDTNKGRKKKVAHVDCMFDGLKHGMELTDGDNNPFHVTNCMTTCADATTFIPPMFRFTETTDVVASKFQTCDNTQSDSIVGARST